MCKPIKFLTPYVCAVIVRARTWGPPPGRYVLFSAKGTRVLLGFFWGLSRVFDIKFRI